MSPGYSDTMTRQPPIQVNKDYNPGGARWCEEHAGVSGVGRLECTKNRSKGRGPCHAPAVRGTNTCRIHGGKKIAVLKANGEAKISAWSAVGPANVDFRMAVLGVLQMTWLRLGTYGELLRRQVAAEGEAASTEPLDPESPGQTSGLIGHRYGAAGKEGHIYAQSEEVRALVALEASERDRVVKYAKTAHDMGISDRLTSLAERWGDVVAGRITLMLESLDLTPEQARRVPELIQAHLGSIDVESLGGGTKREIEAARR